MIQVATAADFRGKRIEYSAMLRTRKAHTNAWFSTKLWIRVEDINGVVIAYQDRAGEAVGDTEWNRHVIVFDVPEEASVLLYGAVIGGAGTFWIDDASIGVVSPERPLVPPGPPPYALGNLNLAIDPTRALPAPMNLDFEETVSANEQMFWDVREQPSYFGDPGSNE